MEELVSIQNIIIYLIAINLIAFLAMFIDKRKAKKGRMRIPEKTLFILVALGGGIGGLAGMYTFRHKTKKMRFVVGFPAILVFEIIVIIAIILTKWDIHKVVHIKHKNGLYYKNS